MSDASATLTPLGVIVLGLLAEDDMHPYAMVRLLRHRGEDRVVKVTNGTLYHTVARLEKDGLITEIGVDRNGNRPERTTYARTEAGREAAAEWVRRELVGSDRATLFQVALAESHTLPRQEVAALLTVRRDALAASAGQHRARLDGALEKGVPLQFLIEQEREDALAHADLAWLDSLLTRLASATLPWGVDEIPAEVATRLADYRKAQSA